MAIAVEELNGTNCKTYLLTAGDSAALVDPVRERVPTYLAELERRGLSLGYVLETHTHADHLMLNRHPKNALSAEVVMHRASPSPLVDRHVDEGDVIELGGERIEVWHTPGHTPDSVCYVFEGGVLTGDTLLISGSGRTDFPGGDAGAQWDAVTTRVFELPSDTVVYPGHDYRGNTTSTVGQEKRDNPRFVGKSRQEYAAQMASLGLPLPERIQQALQVNQSGFEADEVRFPLVTDVARVTELSASELSTRLSSATPPLVLDVREPEEFVGELGHVRGALLVPMDSLERRLPKLAGYVERPIVVVCRAGARSASACAMLGKAGFPFVANLAGGMLAWNDEKLPVER